MLCTKWYILGETKKTTTTKNQKEKTTKVFSEA